MMGFVLVLASTGTGTFGVIFAVGFVVLFMGATARTPT